MNKYLNKKEILKLAFPTIVMMVFMSLYTMVDGVFISKYVNTDALSASNIVAPFMNLQIGISIMFGTGGCAIIMKKTGQNKVEESRKDFTLLILFSIIIGVLFTILSLVYLDKIIYALGATDILFNYSKDYLLYVVIFSIPTILKFIFEQFLTAINKSKLALSLSIFGGILNIILDYIFIVILGMGIKGAAIATGMGYTVPAFIGLLIFTSKKNVLYYTSPSKSLKVIAKTCINGSSEMISQMSSGVIIFLMNHVILKLIGEDGVASITIILYIQFLVSSVFIGYSIGIAPKISYFYGEENHYNLKKLIKFSLLFSSIFGVLVYILIQGLSPYIIKLFTQETSNVYEVTVSGLKIFSISFLFLGINTFLSSMFTAFSNGLISSIIAFLSGFLFQVISISILPNIWGAEGVWISSTFSQALTAVISISLLLKYKKIYKY